MQSMASKIFPPSITWSDAFVFLSLCARLSVCAGKPSICSYLNHMTRRRGLRIEESASFKCIAHLQMHWRKTSRFFGGWGGQSSARSNSVLKLIIILPASSSQANFDPILSSSHKAFLLMGHSLQSLYIISFQHVRLGGKTKSHILSVSKSMHISA